MPPYEDDPALGRPQMMLPRITPVVKRLLIANFVVFGLMFALWLSPGGELRAAQIQKWGGISPLLWAQHFPLVPVWQLLTYGFLHSIDDPWHIFGNMLMLYFFGTMLEERLGGRRFLITYLAAQILGGLVFLSPVLFGVISTPAIGASGACFGVLVALAVLYPRQIVYLLFLPIQLKWVAIGLVGIDAFMALRGFKGAVDGTAHLVHLGGAVYGFIAVRTGLIEKDPVEMIERRRAVARVERAADDEERMDRLLDKIHKEGMGSLTRTEKDFLKRMSSRR
jgi:membrane associated rhomboid family serine protease